jgi:uncharacterized protein DUF6338
MVGFEDILTIALFVIPGYVSIFIIKNITDYYKEKDYSERIMHYIIFSIISYASAIIILLPLLSLFSVFIPKLSINEIWKFSFIEEYSFIFLGVSIFNSVFIGLLLGHFFFAKGHPYDWLNPRIRHYHSIFSDLANKKSNYWVKVTMSNGDIIIGWLYLMYASEENRDYQFGIKEAYRMDRGESISIPGDFIVVCSKNIVTFEVT